MKLAWFFFVSMALHAAALAYPALFLELRAVSPVMVTIIDAHGEGAGGVGGEEGPLVKKPAISARKSPPTKRQQPPVAEPEQVAETPKAISTPVIASEVSSATAISADSTEHSGPVESYSLSSDTGSNNGGTIASATGGSGNGRGGIGNGVGDGVGSGNGKPQTVKASYDYCPIPDYPDSARRRLGGTVILRVLVDEEGKPKTLEVNKSSGFEILDQAAVKHVKQRCRFHPARHGEKRVESLVEFPVVFKLADIKR